MSMTLSSNYPTKPKTLNSPRQESKHRRRFNSRMFRFAFSAGSATSQLSLKTKKKCKIQALNPPRQESKHRRRFNSQMFCFVFSAGFAAWQLSLKKTKNPGHEPTSPEAKRDFGKKLDLELTPNCFEGWVLGGRLGQTVWGWETFGRHLYHKWHFFRIFI